MTYTKQTWTDEVLASNALYNIKQSNNTPINDDVKIELSTPVITAGSPVSASRMNYIEEGIEGAHNLVKEINYKITPAIVSNNLIVTITHADGTTPSASRPLWLEIGNVWRSCTAALSVTKENGTNWANLGSAELGGLPHDLFVYAIWNTNLSGGKVDLLWARKPSGRLYSYFSATTTNENYAAINATAPASTDACENIGRFEATLSLSGTSHLWTVPTYTNDSLVHKPIYHSRLLTYTPVWTNITMGTNQGLYQVLEESAIFVSIDGISSGACSGSVSVTLPFVRNSIFSSVNPIVQARLLDASLGTPAFSGIGSFNTNNVIVQALDSGVAYTRAVNLTATIPFTWAATDRISFFGQYPIGGA